MSDVFKRLAETLDKMPEGYPATESGVEIEILKKIYSESDAEMFLKLQRRPETAEQVAQRLEMDSEETRSLLDRMARDGQIFSFKMKGQQHYMTAPFIPGIYELQINRLDKELVEMVESYFPVFHKQLGGFSPAVSRTIPVNEGIEAESSVQPYENVRQLLSGARSFKVMDCICRLEKAIHGEKCEHTVENCLQFSNEEDAWEYFSLAGRVIQKEEALDIIEKSAKEGLVHNLFYNVQNGFGAVCNCCSCSCGMLIAAKNLKAPYLVARSNFAATIDPDTCSACGVCAEERCPMGAIAETESVYEVQSDVCIGCGVCVIECPMEAITLKLRPENERSAPPETMRDWLTKRMASRGMD